MPVNRILPLCRFSTTILTLVAFAATAPFSMVRAQSLTPPASFVIPHSRQFLYAPIAGVEDFAVWDVAIVNRSSDPMSATLTIYSATGNPFPPSEITLDRNETRHLDIRSLVPPEESTLGGISIDFTGQSMGIAAQVTISGFHGFGNIDVPVFGDMMYKSNDADAVWWEPQGAESHLILGNSSAEPVHAQITFASGERREADLAPHATIVQSIPHARYAADALGQTINSLHVVGTGMAGTLRVTGWVSSAKAGYLDTIRSYDPASSTESAVYANGLHFSDGANHLIVKNLTGNPITVSGAIYPIGTNAPAKPLAVPEKELPPGTSSELKIPTVGNPDSLDEAAIKLESSGPIASIIASYSNHDLANQVTRSVPFKDVGDFSSLTGAYPWRLDGNYSSKVFVTNVGKSRASIGAKILPVNGPEYFIDTKYLEVGETAVFDIRKLRDERVPDPKGVKLPKDAQLGQFVWSTIFGNGKDKLIGRNEVVDRSSGISASFSCPYCNCPYSTNSASINPFNPVVVIDGVASVVATAGSYDTCGRNPPGGYTIYPSSWSITQPYFSLTANQPTSTMQGISNGNSSFYTPFTGIIYAFDGYSSCFVTSQPTLNPGGTGCSGTSITAMNPSQGSVGTTVSPVTIFGCGFSTTLANNTVNAGSQIAATVTNVSTDAKTLTASFAIAPSAGGSYPVTVIVTKADGTKVTTTDLVYFNVPASAPTAVVTQRSSSSQTVSSDNAARNNYNTSQGTYNLGPIIDFETVGTLTPNNYTGSVIIRRTIVNQGLYVNSTSVTGASPNSDDTSAPPFQDRDPQSGGSAGKVYDVDAPRANPPGVDGNTYRYRTNFYTYAALPDGTRLSPNYNFYVRLSCKKTASGNQFVNDVAGDNQIGTCATTCNTPTTWNLQ
jgi:hypothetical protein